MPTFQRQAVRKEHLLRDAKGQLPIERITEWDLPRRLDYAWKVYNSTKNKYTETHKQGALEFLKRTFEIPENPDKETMIQQISALFELKKRTTGRIPNYSDLTAKSAIVEPADVAAPTITPDALDDLRMKNIEGKITGISLIGESITKRKELVFFIRKMNADIDIVNSLISEYNKEQDPVTKFEILKSIHKHQQQTADESPPDYMSLYKNYRDAINITLFNELKKQFATFGVSLLEDDIKKASHTSILMPLHKSEIEDYSFAKILANMAPEKTSALLEILSTDPFDATKLHNLYRDEESPDAKAFKALLESHTIAAPVGANSRNFIITPTAGEPFVLKIENRLNQPKDIERYLRENGLAGILTALPASRQATYTDAATGRPITSNISITEFFPGGNLQENSKRCSSDQDRIDSAIKIYKQVSEELIQIQNAGCAFLDMKNANWLVDSSGKPRVADTKSFLYSASEGQGDKNRWRSLCSSPFMNPVELATAPQTNLPESVDKIHVYMLGKNLYQYLTQCQSEYLYNKNSNFFDFSAPIFSSEQGKQLQKLILQLSAPYADERPSLAEALIQLSNIQGPPPLIDAATIKEAVRAIRERGSEEDLEGQCAPPSIKP